MSMKSWKAEFYPVYAIKAAAASELEAAKHALQKWQGRLPENLERHAVEEELRRGRAPIVGDERDALTFDGATCALCQLPSVTEADDCTACPLSKVRDGYRCDEVMPGELVSPYWSESPGTMIKWLKKAVSYCERRVARRKKS